ncbi:MAG: CAP domain-containing protein [Verrucomicrobiota bacterium]|nr:CAP domain-containing protein [Verrucomicrobiota bacterium]
MPNSRTRTLLQVVCLIAVAHVQAAENAAPADGKPDPAKLFTDYNAVTFRNLESARQRIKLDQVDFDLLSAAAFHETNQRRQKEGRPALQHDQRVREAAQLQATIMAERGSISHLNPELPDKKTPEDRLRLKGLNPAFAAENVATAFALTYTEGEPVYVREENGQKVFSRESKGAPLESHTYLSFAEALLDGWMASPNHRANIVAAEAKYLGVSSRPGTDRMGMPIFFCAQVFYTSLPAGAGPVIRAPDSVSDQGQ